MNLTLVVYPFESRLTKVIAEVMGNEETSAGYGVGSNLGKDDDTTTWTYSSGTWMDTIFDASAGSSDVYVIGLV